jgi:uncharacterized protein YjiS (DUF1127 family)
MNMFPFTATPPAIPARWTASRYRPSTSIAHAITSSLKAVLNIMVEAQDRNRRKRALANLDDRILADIGLTRQDVDEASKWLAK